ncbi:NAD(P)-binding protein [Athelia psychrophila]|uniref:NAD(P)-binding protein n=1 Tax=Athelia psychrophila TaxID=1759441 RepID=A0A167VNS1_9AGAM|nr:NAD(P)-binding protein [Fibularhizoctonia sp. CBS 109695]
MPEKVAIVTGASSGIGRQTAIALVGAGWKVTLTGRRQDALEATQQLCGDKSGNCLVIAGDITGEVFVKKLFEETVHHFERLDLLFNNAGISAPQVTLENMDLLAFTNVLTTNVIGPFLCTKYAFKVFKAQTPQGGRIINNGSISAHTPRPQSAAYTASKHAIRGLSKSTALDGRDFNITCTEIDIGNVHTDMAAGFNTGALQADGTIKTEKTFDVRHVANTVVHIASLPLNVTVLEINIMASTMPFVGRG